MGLFDELKKLTHTYEDEDDEYEEDFPDVRKPDNTAALFDDRRRERSEERRSNKVVNIHATTQLKVVLVSPQHFEDASGLAVQLESQRAVVLNLGAPHKDVARRLVDFLSGVAYAGEGKIKRVANSTYIITPYHVDIEGDLINELESNGLYF